jgi:hypothetical protein
LDPIVDRGEGPSIVYGSATADSIKTSKTSRASHTTGAPQYSALCLVRLNTPRGGLITESRARRTLHDFRRRLQACSCAVGRLRCGRLPLTPFCNLGRLGVESTVVAPMQSVKAVHDMSSALHIRLRAVVTCADVYP